MPGHCDHIITHSERENNRSKNVFHKVGKISSSVASLVFVRPKHRHPWSIQIFYHTHVVVLDHHDHPDLLLLKKTVVGYARTPCWLHKRPWIVQSTCNDLDYHFGKHPSMAWYTAITTAITFDCPPPSPKDTLSDNTSPITNCDTLVTGKVL